MSSPPFGQRLLALLLLLPLASCAIGSTLSSIARIERPKLPTINPDLVRTERLNPLTAQPSGTLLTIDTAVLEELYVRLAEYAAAVERGNIRAGGVRERDRCVAALFATGKPAPGCPVAPN